MGEFFMLGERIRKMRIAAGFNQAELAKKLGIAQSTLSGYETGFSMPNYDMVENIATFCEFDIMFLDKNSMETI